MWWKCDRLNPPALNDAVKTFFIFTGLRCDCPRFFQSLKRTSSYKESCQGEFRFLEIGGKERVSDFFFYFKFFFGRCSSSIWATVVWLCSEEQWFSFNSRADWTGETADSLVILVVGGILVQSPWRSSGLLRLYAHGQVDKGKDVVFDHDGKGEEDCI